MTKTEIVLLAEENPRRFRRFSVPLGIATLVERPRTEAGIELPERFWHQIAEESSLADGYEPERRVFRETTPVHPTIQ